jgi:hypothetical protein
VPEMCECRRDKPRDESGVYSRCKTAARDVRIPWLAGAREEEIRAYHSYKGKARFGKPNHRWSPKCQERTFPYSEEITPLSWWVKFLVVSQFEFDWMRRVGLEPRLPQAKCGVQVGPIDACPVMIARYVNGQPSNRDSGV